MLKRQIKTSGSLDLIEKLLSNPYFTLNFVVNTYQWKNYIAKLVLIITGWMYKTWEIILFLLSIDSSHGLGLIKRTIIFFLGTQNDDISRDILFHLREGANLLNGHKLESPELLVVWRAACGKAEERRICECWEDAKDSTGQNPFSSHGRKCCLQQGKWQQCLLIPDCTKFLDHFMMFSHFPLIFKSFIEYL